MASMSVRTKRWNDPAEPDDGYRLLVCRYRPRGVPKVGEPWDAWCPALAPSKALHAAAYGKTGAPLDFPDYEKRFRAEMDARRFWITGYADRVRRGETVTLLCSSACTDEARCHRTIVKQLLERAAFPPAPRTAAQSVVKRRRAEGGSR
jgi:uncharacterized protein YeaO (DUF488 family)